MSKMNLPLFLKTVDGFTKDMSHGELEVFIHDLARTLPEHKRDGFIDKLKEIGKAAEPDEVYRESDKSNRKNLLDQIAEVKQILVQVDEGELCLVGVLNEEYDDWYNSDADEFLFEDPEDVLEAIGASVDLIHKCVDQALYEEGYELAEMLSLLEVQAGGDYADYCGDSLSLSDLKYYHLLTCDLEQLGKDSLYLSYKGNELTERSDAIYRMMNNLKCRNISLEDVMQNGNGELEQFDEFLKLWIEYLGTCKGTDKLLLEAQSLLNDDEQTLANARTYAKQHPELYEQYLRQNLATGNDSELFEIGQEALAVLPDNFVARSRIALLAAQYALRIQNIDKAEQSWVEAFRSETNPVNYMRIFIESRDYSIYREAVTDIYAAMYKKSGKGSNYQYGREGLNENQLNSNDYYALLFLDGEFQKVMDEGMNVKKPLGWSSTFMKQGMALFMLYLFRGEELPAGLKAMCSCAAGQLSFKAEDYCKGLERTEHGDNVASFWKYFCKWKEKASMPEENQPGIIKKLEDWIDIRVEGIMQANRRNYYYECASFVAALGEVKESRGELAGKQKVMNAYREKYSRRRAFHQDLRALGLKK